MSTRQVIVKSLQKYTQEINAGGHVLTADEPLDLGGDDKGPNPYELLLSALGGLHFHDSQDVCRPETMAFG